MHRPAAIMFDLMGTLLDLDPTYRAVAGALGGEWALGRIWNDQALQHAAVVTLAGQYRDFAEVGAACLRMLAEDRRIGLTEGQAKATLAPLRSAPPFPDVPGALERLKAAGHRVVALTNSGKSALAEQLKNARLARFFDAALSVEDVGRFKPDREAYLWAARTIGVEPGGVLFVAAHGWDVAGAAWAGMRTAFLARPHQQTFPLAPPPEWRGADLGALADALAK